MLRIGLEVLVSGLSGCRVVGVVNLRSGGYSINQAIVWRFCLVRLCVYMGQDRRFLPRETESRDPATTRNMFGTLTFNTEP